MTVKVSMIIRDEMKVRTFTDVEEINYKGHTQIGSFQIELVIKGIPYHFYVWTMQVISNENRSDK